MNRSFYIIIIMVILALPSVTLAGQSPMEALEGEFSEITLDYKRFYTDRSNYLKLGGALAVGGFAANTSFDREVHEYYRDNIRSSVTDGISDVVRLPGEVLFTIPALIGVAVLTPDSSPGVWARRSLRALFLGGPLALFLQRATGGGRPSEGPSEWRPFSNNNGFSGHAFMGGVPIITAAKMTEDPYLKAAFYVLSAFPALSRINDDKHYASQAFLGWYLAYLSSSAVISRNTETISLRPLLFRDDGFGVVFTFDF